MEADSSLAGAPPNLNSRMRLPRYVALGLAVQGAAPWPAGSRRVKSGWAAHHLPLALFVSEAITDLDVHRQDSMARPVRVIVSVGNGASYRSEPCTRANAWAFA
jgi:hypothetical protein